MSNVIKLTESELNNTIRETIRTFIKEAKESTLAANKMRKRLYRGVSEITGSLYSDTGWNHVDNVMARIESIVGDEGEATFWCKNTGYVKNNQGEIIYKEWQVLVTLNNGGRIRGAIRANPAGTLDDPFKRYDITCTFERDTEPVMESAKARLCEGTIDNRKYTHYAVGKASGKIVNGWEYGGYDPADLRSDPNYYFFDDLAENGFKRKDYTILNRASCVLRGIDPAIDENWGNR
jgi:hypothetical protein